MTMKSATTLSMASLFLAIMLPASAQTPAVASTDASHLMPAQAVLNQTIDAAKATPGTQFRVKLSAAAHLSNGQNLPYGTELVGTIVNDENVTPGAPKLALRFTQAVLKNGQVVPIKATIVGLAQAGDSTIAATGAVPASWNDGSLHVDQVSVATGLELHSRAASNNSGVISSSKKKDVKLSAGDQLALAIAPQTADQPVDTTSNAARR